MILDMIYALLFAAGMVGIPALVIWLIDYVWNDITFDSRVYEGRSTSIKQPRRR